MATESDLDNAQKKLKDKMKNTQPKNQNRPQ